MISSAVQAGQTPVFDTVQFQDTTTVHLNAAMRESLLDLLEEFDDKELSRQQIAFRLSLRNPRSPEKPGARSHRSLESRV